MLEEEWNKPMKTPFNNLVDYLGLVIRILESEPQGSITRNWVKDVTATIASATNSHLELLDAVNGCILDLAYYAKTHGMGPDRLDRLDRLLKAYNTAISD